MKRIFLLILTFIIITACDDNKKISLVLKPKKELKINFKNQDFINKVSFIFVIDISGSMEKFNNNLADNLNRVLSPILKKYPYYNYHFAFTTMYPRSILHADRKPFYSKLFLDECSDSKNIKLKQSNLGNYLEYSYNYLNELDIDTLLCVLNLNIRFINKEPKKVQEESFFQSIEYILGQSDVNIKKDFFNKDNILNLFFISDSWQGVGYIKELAKRPQDKKETVAKDLADKLIKKFKTFFDIETHLRSYAVVHSIETLDECTKAEGSGEEIDHYPFHLYQFIEQTNGLRLSICDDNWGEKLGQISNNFLSSVELPEIFLEDFPQIDTIELYFNQIKIPQDFEKGWFFNPEKLAIEIGPKFNWFYYLSQGAEQMSENKLRILYHPLNLQIFQEGGTND